MNKTSAPPHTEQGRDPLRRRAVPCEPGAAIVLGRSPNDPLALRLLVDHAGNVSATGQARAFAYLLQYPDARPYAVVGEQEPEPAQLDRCSYLRERATKTREASWNPVAAQCTATPASR